MVLKLYEEYVVGVVDLCVLAPIRRFKNRERCFKMTHDFRFVVGIQIDRVTMAKWTSFIEKRTNRIGELDSMVFGR